MTQNALITGASSGIGYALANVFAREGYNLILVARSADKLNALQKQLTAQHNISAVVLPFDLTEIEAPRQLFEQVQAQNLTVDVLVNCAGYGDYGEFSNSDWPKQQGIIFLNIHALTYLCRLCLPGMIERGQGKILNVASTAAFQPGPRVSIYFASKAYVLSLGEAIATELEDTGVTVTTLCPGPTRTAFIQTANFDQIAVAENDSLDAMPSAEAVAEYGYKAMKKGKVVAVHGLFNKFLAFSVRFAPRGLIRRGVYQFMAPKSSKEDD